MIFHLILFLIFVSFVVIIKLYEPFTPNIAQNSFQNLGDAKYKINNFIDKTAFLKDIDISESILLNNFSNNYVDKYKNLNDTLNNIINILNCTKDGVYFDKDKNQCNICEANYQCKNGVKNECEPGTYSSLGSSSCRYETTTPYVETTTPNPKGKDIKLVFKTSNVSYAGTDSQVVITFIDENNRPVPFYLDNPGNDFEAGKTDTYIIDNPNIGLDSITKKDIKLEVIGGGDWKVESLTIYYDEDLVKQYTLNTWIGDGNDSVPYIELSNN